MTVPKLTVTLEHEDEVRVRIVTDSEQDFDALVCWLESREDFRWFVEVLGALYRLAKDSGDA